MNNTQLTDSFIFMKVGNHAGETFDKILERKKKEFDQAGMTFWGYGGMVCHPVNQVRPFSLSRKEKNGSIYLLMNYVKSNFSQSMIPAKEYSLDGQVWQPIPKDIVVTGSKYALVLDEIQPMGFEIDLGHFNVAIGPSKGKPGSEYLKGRTDKACLENNIFTSATTSDIRQVDYAAQLKEPFAVMLKY